MLLAVHSGGESKALYQPRGQERFVIGSVKVEQTFKVGLVVIGVGQGADQRAVQVQIDLFDQGVRQIIGRPQGFGRDQIASISFFQGQFHGEVTPSQIGEPIHPGNDEFHGVDARRRRLDGHHAIGHRTDVRFGHLEQIESGIGRALRHVVRPHFGHVSFSVVFFWSAFFD